MPTTSARSSRLQVAALTSIGDEGRPEQVEEKLTRSIFAGAFADGERLPSESELARLLGVSVVTVREALFALRAKGLIETKRGRGGGSFITAKLSDSEMHNSLRLIDMPRVELADLGLHYEMISAACAEMACLRATPDELEIINDLLSDARNYPQAIWRRRITDIQMELASLSQSVNLTGEHVRVQTSYTPLLALQDADMLAREATQLNLESLIRAIYDEDVALARKTVREGIRDSTRWLIQFRSKLIEDPREEKIIQALAERNESKRFKTK